ncbi:MAG: MarR family transcriptional regulator [Myxococcaceae bacterium]
MAEVSDLDEPLEPALDFLQHLWRLNHALERMSLTMDRKLGITAQQRLVLRCIGQYPGLAASQLAGVLHLDRGTVSVALARLSAKGLVVGKREAADRRRVALNLSARGRDLVKPSALTVEASVDRLLRRNGAASIRTVRRVLQDLADDLNAQVEKA